MDTKNQPALSNKDILDNMNVYEASLEANTSHDVTMRMNMTTAYGAGVRNARDGYEPLLHERDARIAALESRLHRMYAHPDYEYEQSTTGRKQTDYKGENLEEAGWEVNADAFGNGFDRDDYTDTRYWRRRKPLHSPPSNNT